jgi:hypothetical protein
MYLMTPVEDNFRRIVSLNHLALKDWYDPALLPLHDFPSDYCLDLYVAISGGTSIGFQ